MITLALGRVPCLSANKNESGRNTRSRRLVFGVFGGVNKALTNQAFTVGQKVELLP